MLIPSICGMAVSWGDPGDGLGLMLLLLSQAGSPTCAIQARVSPLGHTALPQPSRGWLTVIKVLPGWWVCKLGQSWGGGKWGLGAAVPLLWLKLSAPWMEG